MKKIINIFLIAVLFLILIPSSEAFCSVNILGIRHWTAPDYTRIVIDTDNEPQFEINKQDGRVSIDIKDTAFPKTIPNLYILNKPAINRISLIPLSQNRLRVELRLPENVKVNIFKLQKILNKPYRIVIDATLPEVEKKEIEERGKVRTLKKEKKVVVIDAGHGGEDPGAVGRRKTLEKNIVLKISKRLKNKLTRNGYQVFLTRKGDYYISFKQRMGIAREYGADIFISIHADAARSRSARGCSVYCLSTSGASNEAIKLLAASQNLSDIIGGSVNGQNNVESDPIILNMVQTETINQSKAFGSVVLKKLKPVNRLKYSKVHEAPFRILKLPDITSILVETAYISNPREELLLRSASYQEKVADAITSAIVEFLPPPPDVLRKIKKAESASSGTTPFLSTYIVKKGDFLEKIAEKHGTTVQTLLKLNKLKSRNKIYVNQKLKVPSQFAVYTVKKGDNLERIAKRYGTTTRYLMKINRLKSKNKIYVKQKLKVPCKR
jgi:N-acetylmuramoyl-L-alanine amidase